MCLANGIIFYTATKLQIFSIKNIDIIKIISISYVTLITSFILGAVFLHDKVGLTDIIGSLLVLGYNLYNAIYPEWVKFIDLNVK